MPKYRLGDLKEDQIPRYGVYFFFEDGETLDDDSSRVVRVGTHAISEKKESQKTVWDRLSNHRIGNAGNSIFRKLVGEALVRQKHLSKSDVRGEVNDRLVNMQVLVVRVGNKNGQKARKRIEGESLRLLSWAYCTSPASPNWLGHHSNRKVVRCSGLWNQRGLDGDYDPAFLDELEDFVKNTPSPNPQAACA